MGTADAETTWVISSLSHSFICEERQHGAFILPNSSHSREMLVFTLWLSACQSQNHKMVEAQRQLWTNLVYSSSFRSFISSRLSRTTSKYLLKISNSPQSPWKIISSAQSTSQSKNPLFLQFLCFSFCLLPLVLSLDTTVKSLGTSRPIFHAFKLIYMIPSEMVQFLAFLHRRDAPVP